MAAHAFRAVAQLRAKRFDPAIADFETVLASDPKYAFALFGRWVAKKLKGMEAAGNADIAAAKALVPTIATSFEKYGVRGF